MMRSWFQNFLALVVIAAYIGVIAFWTVYPPKGPEAVISVLITLVGSLGSLAGAIVGYYFGSSKGSTMKDQALAAALAPEPPKPEQ